MADNTKIEWTDASWNPIRARNLTTGKVGWHCEHASDGCRFCYAEGMNHRLGTGLPFKPGHRNDVEIFLDEKLLLQPLKWKRPRMIFVCSMTDLFADFVPDAMIDRVFAAMALTPWHTYQVLTKRSARMLEFFTAHRRAPPYYEKRVPGHTPVMRLQALIADFVRLGHFQPNGYGPVYAEDTAKARDRMRFYPLPNVWLGVSAERQQEADARIPDLLATPAAVRFVSLEPLLGRIEFSVPLRKISANVTVNINALTGEDGTGQKHARLDWVIVGGESQRGARPMHPDWARALRDQCTAAGVPFFFKQWGEWADRSDGFGGNAKDIVIGRDGRAIGFDSGDGLSFIPPVDWRESGGAWMVRVGKKGAGRLLDGVEHNAMPSAAPGDRIPAEERLGAVNEPAEAG